MGITFTLRRELIDTVMRISCKKKRGSRARRRPHTACCRCGRLSETAKLLRPTFQVRCRVSQIRV